jgi:acyl-CoA dehydrogenase
MSDLSMALLGGALKRKEKLSARLGDVLSLLYLCSASLKRFEDEGRQHADAAVMHWSIRDALYQSQCGLEGAIANFPNRLVAAVMRFVVFPLGRPHAVPSDELGHRVAQSLIEPSTTRDRLTAGVRRDLGEHDPVGLLERALHATIHAEPVEQKIRHAIRQGLLDAQLQPGAGSLALVERAETTGIIDAEEGARIKLAHELTARVIRVDDFPQDLDAAQAQGAETLDVDRDARDGPPRESLAGVTGPTAAGSPASKPLRARSHKAVA